MKHRKGIDLGTPRDQFVHTLSQEETAWLTFDRLEEWYDLGVRCSRCEREGWVDRHELAKRWPGVVFISLVSRLRCRKCGNKGGGSFMIRKQPR